MSFKALNPTLVCRSSRKVLHRVIRCHNTTTTGANVTTGGNAVVDLARKEKYGQAMNAFLDLDKSKHVDETTQYAALISMSKCGNFTSVSNLLF